MVVILRPTLKLAAHLDLGPLEEIAPTSDPLADWCVRSFQVGRTPYLLFSNTPSLFSMVVRRRGVTDEKTMIRALGAALGNLLHATNQGGLFEQRIAPLLDGCTLARNRDRSVVGSMNDLAYQSVGYLETGELDFVEVHSRLNSAPMGALQMDSPSEVFFAMASESR